MALTRINGPAVEPLDLAEAKLHLRVDHGHEDALISALIRAAREWTENYLARTLIESQWEMTLDAFPCGLIEIPFGPVTEIGAVEYVDLDGVDSLADEGDIWQADLGMVPARLVPVNGQSWPATKAQLNAVKITYTAGYGETGTSVPEPIRQAMKLLIGDWYENRGQSVIGTLVEELPMAVPHLLSMYRVDQI